MRPDFGLFVGTEWMIPCLTLGGTACMSVFGGIAPRFVQQLYAATTAGRMKEALELQYKFSDLYQINKVEYPAPTKAMWEIMGRPVGEPRLPNRPIAAGRQEEDQGNIGTARAVRYRTARLVGGTQDSSTLTPAETRRCKKKQIKLHHWGENKMKNLLKVAVAALGLYCVALAPSLADDWPSRPIRLIVPFPAGGGTDFVARLVAKSLSDRLHQTIIVENRGGANGATGLTAVMQSAPDGYTIAATSDSPLTVNPWMYKNLAYDPLKSFIPVASVVRLPGMLAVNPSTNVHSIAELIALAKAKPGQLNYASAGVGNFSHLAMELFAQATGIKLQHVPYKGTGPASLALLSGEVQMGFNNVQTLIQNVQAGKLVALGVGEPKRMAQHPELPTIAETVPGYDIAPWVGIVVPAGTPKAIVDRLEKETLAVMQEPAMVKQCMEQDLTVMALNHVGFTDLIKSDSAKWEKVTKSAGMDDGIAPAGN